ncbi:MAG: amino acid ABC transporter substrate-binding protein [Verrucomicrobia bacterium]|nr:MAG: amino acid ABC transporter substrate-binding protein [Verrucomicrobiota bacterium]
MDLSYPPFETIRPDGSPAGISVEIAKHLGEYLHRPIRIENVPFAGLILSLQTHKIDLIISSMTDTAERRQSIAFSEPYLKIGLALLIPKGSGIHRVEELNTAARKVAVRQGTTAQIWALQNLPQATILIFEKEAAAVREVTQRRVDAFLYDQMSIWKYWQLHQEKCDAILHQFSHEDWAIGLRKGDTALLTQVNAFLRDFRKQGGFEKLGNQYLGDQKRAFRELGIPLYF